MSETIVALGEVVENENVAPGHFRMGVRLPLAFAEPQPGQFVMVRSAIGKEPLLARPLSVYGFERRKDHCVLELLYRVAGEGTAFLARMKPGEPISILGPLGTGFSAPEGMDRALFIAGGVGVAPLTYLLRRGMPAAAGWNGVTCVFYVGAKTGELLLGLDKLTTDGGPELRICTDDGSRGEKGFVTALLKQDIDGYDPRKTVLYSCGPGPMVRSLGYLLENTAFSCQVSLEERMACGLGACLGCAVAVRSDEGRSVYQRVCKDGPVFDLRRIHSVPSATA